MFLDENRVIMYRSVRRTKDEQRQNTPTPPLYFSHCFPGLLLHTYTALSLDYLREEQASRTASMSPPSAEDDSLVFLDREDSGEIAVFGTLFLQFVSLHLACFYHLSK